MGNVFTDNAHADGEDTSAVDRIADEVAARTDLSPHICRELLLNGWSFKQEIGKPDRWEKVY